MKHRMKRLARILTAGPLADDVHFHADAAGRPFVCDNARCTSPGLDLARD